ncbi:MAG: glutamine-hydrolyzing GMP synthase [Ignavibacteria bacterium]|nr:glutamine-hydrolyzing GMP synthase [Ignavibacteria bacterium]
MNQFDKILILDFGSQYTQLIARRVREFKVYSEIFPFNHPMEKIKNYNPKGIILSGGPSSIYEKNAPIISEELVFLKIPILGICYGMQILVNLFNGKIIKAPKREYGFAELILKKEREIFEGISRKSRVWMSHGDYITKLPANFSVLGYTANTPYAAIGDISKKIFALQFHPEVIHTTEGKKILKNFIFKICNCKANWKISSFIEDTIKSIREKTHNKKVLCALSGGVDSSVVALLIHKAIGKNLTCIFVDNGLLRLNEPEKVNRIFRKNFDMNLISIDAKKQFLKQLKGITDPERKRKIIGNEFIKIFEAEAKKIREAEFLAQGTLYPDVIESVSFKGPSATIKSHHNVGGLPEKMNLKLIEPLKELFKDEVRIIGRKIGLPEEICMRQPFPGPGLAVRITGEITEERIRILQLADDILVGEIKKADLYKKLWQSFAVLLSVKTVGVMGDERSYENVIAIRAVTSQDGMTADWAKLPYRLLNTISGRIINEVKGVNRVVYDISSKPPSTIEWE